MLFRSRQSVVRQLADSGQNAALVAPQLAVDAADSSAGNFWRPGYFAKYLDEAAERLMRLFGDRRVGAVFNTAPVIIVAYSGGYLPAIYSLARGGAEHRVRGVMLMDALYGEESKVAAWLAARRISYSEGLPPSLVPGTISFVATGGLEMHGDFMTRAWGPDPLRQALTLIPGYPRVPPPPPPKPPPKPPPRPAARPAAKPVVKSPAKPATKSTTVRAKSSVPKRRVP